MPAIAIHGTASNAGKTIIATALCRIFADKGYSVAPFKAQNMSLNSCVIPEGKIALAQALQARAAKIEPIAEMNPILLMPKAERISQVIVRGKPYADMNVREYHEFVERRGRGIVKTSLRRLSSEYNLIILEGAGSPAEINILQHDIVNTYPARLMDAKCILVHNVERGGLLAYLFGTLSLLQDEKDRYEGVIINKFHGESLEVSDLDRVIGKPVLGVVPCIENLRLPAEDSLGLEDGYNDDLNVDGLDDEIDKLARIVSASVNMDKIEAMIHE